jgi:hypothetical protein
VSCSAKIRARNHKIQESLMKASFRDYVSTLRKNDELLEISKPEY